MATPDFTYDKIKLMIELYRAQECMWNMQHPAYNDRTRRRLHTEEIAQALNMPVDAIIKKWANLRTYFLRETTKWEKSKNTSDGSHEVKQPDWVYFRQLDSFLRGQFHRRSTMSSLTTPIWADRDEDRSGSPDSQATEASHSDDVDVKSAILTAAALNGQPFPSCDQSASSCNQPADPSYDQPAVSSFDQSIVASYSQPTGGSCSQPVVSSYQNPAVAAWCQPVLATYGQPATASYGQPADVSVEEATGPLEDDDDDLPVRKKPRRQLQFEVDDGLVLVMRGADHKTRGAAARAEDEQDVFGKIVAHGLRNIADAKLREKTKLRINEILFEARFG